MVTSAHGDNASALSDEQMMQHSCHTLVMLYLRIDSPLHCTLISVCEAGVKAGIAAGAQPALRAKTALSLPCIVQTLAVK